MSRSKTLLAVIAIIVVLSVLATSALAAPRTSSASAAGTQSGFLAAVNRVFVNQALNPALQTAPQAQVAQPAAAATAAPAQSTTINIQPGADTESQILEAVYQKVNPSVVQVINLASPSVSAFGGGSSPFGGRGRGNTTPQNPSSGQAVPQGEGSGFVWDKQGHIVTNDHVVEGATKLQVVFADGTQVDATLVGTDPNGDIAVIKVDPSQSSALVPVEVADMSSVKVGDLAIAIGNPFGFTGTMTRGIVSALGRTIPSQTSFNIPQAIQTDAAINPGNSGGPLLNEKGQVIGVNDQIQSASGSNSGVGFAIPISIVNRIVPSIIQGGQYQHAYLGLAGQTYSKVWAQALGFPADAKGVYVAEVTAGGPAAKAGLRGGSQDTNILLGSDQSGSVYLQSGGDLVTAVDGQKLTKMDDLLMYLEEHASPGQQIKLTVLRNGQQQTITVTLGARPTQTTS